jgi:hypothetical protein
VMLLRLGNLPHKVKLAQKLAGIKPEGEAK